MKKRIQTLTIFIAFFLSSMTLIGCYIEVDDDDNGYIDLEPPAVPRGVRTITGDGYVDIQWYPNAEFDLAGYFVWRSTNNRDFDEIANLPVGTTHDTSYTDWDVRNGRTYYYAVSAYDSNNPVNESDLSAEDAWDTPRPEGRNIILDDYFLEPDRSGFDFSHAAKGTIAWDDRTTDVYFGFDTEINVSYLYSENNTQMQDLGFHQTFDGVDVVPTEGYTTLFVELLEGHIYAIITPDGNYAKIHVRRVTDLEVVFDWAYQTDQGNFQLAPKLQR